MGYLVFLNFVVCKYTTNQTTLNEFDILTGFINLKNRLRLKDLVNLDKDLVNGKKYNIIMTKAEPP